MPSRRRRSAVPARHLVLRHARRILAHKGVLPSPTDPPKLAPGYEQLFSYYTPALEAGSYTVKVTQTITPGDELPLLVSTQKFNVVAPRFTLPSDSIHSVYPPQGYTELVEVLPHVVLNDPHLPWERVASETHRADYAQNRVPWLAVVAFTQDELRLDSTALNGAASIFTATTGMKNPVVQSATLAVGMAVADVWATKETCTPITGTDDAGVGAATTDIVFLKAGLFTTLFTTYDAAGNQVPGQTAPDVGGYRFLSHVREINTTGMAEAGVEDEGLFSIVVSSRVGPMTITQPTPVVVHLLSIEGVEDMAFPITTTYVAMSSLHSWTYTCLPPGSLNVFDTFRHLGESLNVLRVPDAVIAKVQSQGPEGERVAKRLSDGYTLAKYRTATGEITAAITRGALTPTVVPHPLKNLTSLSTCGSDLQILDQEVGLMDITYSAAWQLGKTLALADRAFTTALARVRSTIHATAMNDAKAEILRARGGYKSRAETIESLVSSIQTLNGLHEGTGLHEPGGMVRRWRRTPVPPVDLTYRSDNIALVYDRHAQSVATKLASSSDGDGSRPYDEFNTPCSADWMTVISWVLDRMYLVNIPAHYLITDPLALEPESLRFFHIDANWVDALIDGALSVANHLDRDDDRVRIAIKEAINKYLASKHPDLEYPAQIPTYGFLLRSDLVSKFPDLVVHAPFPDPATPRAPILRHENIANGVMLCLFDRVPSAAEFQSLTFSQPPHQQSFVAGVELDPAHIEMHYKRVYTVPDPKDDVGLGIGNETWYSSPTMEIAQLPPVFKWGGVACEVRSLLVEAWAQHLLEYVQAHMDKLNPAYFTDTHATAAFCGFQLNNPIWKLEIILTQRPSLEGLHAALGGVRALAMLKPRIRRKLGAPPMVEAQLEHREALPPPAEATMPPATLRAREMPLHPRAPPPHYNFPRGPPLTPGPTTRGPSSSNTMLFRTRGIAQPPDFRYSCYPANSTSDSVPTQTGLPVDLVFSVRCVDGLQDAFLVREITLNIRMGPMTSLRKNLISNYHGPGATMLSNLRFNVLAEIKPGGGGPQDSTLALRLLPRSVTGLVPINMCEDLSFMLSMVVLNEYETQVDVLTDVREVYKADDVPNSFAIHLDPRDVD